MSLLRTLIDNMFAGNDNPLVNIIKQTDDGTSPNGVTTAPKGTFCIIDYDGNATDTDIYINSDGSTGWIMIRDAS